MSAVMQKIRVPATELRPGMYVCELDRPWDKSPFLFQGFPLQSTQDVTEVQRHCTFVYIDPVRSSGWAPRRRAPAEANAAAVTERLHGVGINLGTRPRSRPLSPTRWVQRTLAVRRNSSRAAVETIHRMEVAERSFGWSTRMVHTALSDVRLGRSLDVPAAREAVSGCAEQITRDTDAMLLLGSIKSKDDYTAQHSLNVAIFSMILGRRLGLSHGRLRELGLAALLHDVGKVLIPDAILKKPGRLDPGEMTVMRRHTVHGREVLLGCEGTSRSAVTVAHDHHERLDGSGYPRGLKEEDTDLYTRIVAITDTFDAITSNRVYGNARTTIEAFKVLRAASGNNYDEHLVSQFVTALGIFPPGSAVQLNDGKFGVVVRANPRHELRPLVLVMRDASLKEVRPRYLDLAEIGDRRGRPLQVARMVRGDEFGIDTAMFRNPQFLQSLAG
jgi:HD-GYP domain-containing protein (c-di-GMP phosphodiesterase class II)